MIRNALPLLAGVVAIGCGCTAAAQEQAVAPAPESIESMPDRPKFYAIDVNAYANYTPEVRREAVRWRRTELREDAHTYFTGEEPVFAAVLADPAQPSLRATLDLGVTPGGKVGDCAATPKTEVGEELVQALCALVRDRLEFLPALDAERAPMADKARFYFSARHYAKRPDQQAFAIHVRERSAPPAPMLLPNYRQPRYWPPVKSRNLPLARPTFRHPSAVEDATFSPYSVGEHTIAGVTVFTGNDGRIDCETVDPSGNSEFDAGACDYLFERSGPSFDAASFATKYGYPMLVVGKGAPERIIAPVADLSRWVYQSVGTRDAFFAEFLPAFAAAGGDRSRIRLSFDVGPDGKVRDCTIGKSSGTTEADIMACDFVERSLAYEPATDLFGRPREVGVYWRIPEEQ